MAICLAQVFFLVGAAAAAATTVQEKKDKIGERVAALQQLVSPFGKVLVFCKFFFFFAALFLRCFLTRAAQVD
jgi:hypothetical protein